MPTDESIVFRFEIRKEWGTVHRIIDSVHVSQHCGQLYVTNIMEGV